MGVLIPQPFPKLTTVCAAYRVSVVNVPYNMYLTSKTSTRIRLRRIHFITPNVSDQPTGHFTAIELLLTIQLQVYDRYTYRAYDVIPVTALHTLPPEYAAPLQFYTYILVEAGLGTEFTERRICPTCETWCKPDKAIVKCVACREAFHLNCVGLTRRPTKGYAWQCAMCLKKEYEKREGSTSGMDKGTRRGKEGKGGGNDAIHIKVPERGASFQAGREDISVPARRTSLRRESNKGPVSQSSGMNAVLHISQMQRAHVLLTFYSASSVPMANMTDVGEEKPLWPFRYFGEYSKFSDLIDVGRDKGHPKACSR